MSSQTTRKSFLAQLLGVLASVFASKLVARPAAAVTPVTGEAAPVKLITEPRAVARTQDSV